MSVNQSVLNGYEEQRNKRIVVVWPGVSKTEDFVSLVSTAGKSELDKMTVTRVK